MLYLSPLELFMWAISFWKPYFSKYLNFYFGRIDVNISSSGADNVSVYI